MPSTVCVPESLVSILEQNSGAEPLVESNVYTLVEKFNLGCLTLYLCIWFGFFVCLKNKIYIRYTQAQVREGNCFKEGMQ